MPELPKPGQVDPPFDPWKTPPGIDPVDPNIIAAIRQSLLQSPIPVPISQIPGYTRVISGTVDGGSGNILRESPADTFTPTKTATGKYSVAFASGMFSLPPSITVSWSDLAGGGAANNRSITYGNVTKDGFDVEISNPSPAFTDVDWSFFASGA